MIFFLFENLFHIFDYLKKKRKTILFESVKILKFIFILILLKYMCYICICLGYFTKILGVGRNRGETETAGARH